MIGEMGEIGKLGFGFMRMPSSEGLGIDVALLEKMVDRFLESGFTYFDTAYVYPGSEEALREVLVKRHPRKAFNIATKMPLFVVKEAKDMQATFETSLERLGVEYLDYYLLHGLTLEKCRKLEEMGCFEFMKRLKEEGRVRHNGFSLHDTPEHLDEILKRHPEMEFVQLQINYYDWENEEVQSRRLYETGRKHGKPIIIMEPVKGGLLAGEGSSAEKALSDAAPGRTAASWAVRFASTLDGVLTMLSGMGTMAQLEDNIRTVQEFKPLTETEVLVIGEVTEKLRNMPRIQCTGCKYCVPNCPRELRIPELIRLYNEYLVYKQKNSSGFPYEAATSGGREPSECTGCRTCEKHCPQGIEISGVLEEMAAVFEGK